MTGSIPRAAWPWTRRGTSMELPIRVEKDLEGWRTGFLLPPSQAEFGRRP